MSPPMLHDKNVITRWLIAIVPNVAPAWRDKFGEKSRMAGDERHTAVGEIHSGY
jgi:hypothetical protein